MAHAGEESGKLAESLRVVAVQMQRASALSKQIKGALIYPLIVILAMIVIGILMLIYVVPTLSETFSALGSSLPPTTAFLVAASTLLVNHTLLFVATILLFL